MLAEGGFLDSPYGNCTDKAWLLLSAPNYCRIILRTFCMHLAHPLPSDGWHLRGIMAFIIILSTLIDTLFDQRRYPLWIRVSRCQKCKIPLIRNASSVFIPFPPTLICPLSLFFASRLSSFFLPLPDTFESHITFQTVHRKRSNIPSHSLFLTDVPASSLPVVAEMDPGQRRLWTGKESWARSFSARCTGWFDLVQAIASYEILDMHSNTSTFSDPVKPSCIFFDREYMHLKFVFITAQQTLKNTYMPQVLWLI